MIIGGFVDYYDTFLDPSRVFYRESSNEVKISDLNSYRYTLIIGYTCYDFVIRNNEIILGDGLKSFGELKFGNYVKLRCEMFDSFTHCVCRIKPYRDKFSFNEKNNSMISIIQDRTKEHNHYDKEPPIYMNASSVYLNPKLNELGFENVMDPALIASILNVLPLKK